MDVFTMLKEDHAKVKMLFKEFEGSSEKALKKKETIADKVCDDEGKDLVNEALEEHRIVKRLIKELKAFKAEAKPFEAKFKVLRDVVEHHIEEEENELFPREKKDLGYDTEEINTEAEDRKEYLEEKPDWPTLF